MNNNEQSVFLEQFGDTPFNRALEFFIVYQNFDYSITQTAKEAGIAYVTAKLLMPVLVEKGIIVLSRKVGKAKMYKANMKNKNLQVFDRFWAQLNMAAMEKERQRMKIHA